MAVFQSIIGVICVAIALFTVMNKSPLHALVWCFFCIIFACVLITNETHVATALSIGWPLAGTTLLLLFGTSLTLDARRHRNERQRTRAFAIIPLLIAAIFTLIMAQATPTQPMQQQISLSNLDDDVMTQLLLALLLLVTWIGCLVIPKRDYLM